MFVNKRLYRQKTGRDRHGLQSLETAVRDATQGDALSACGVQRHWSGAKPDAACHALSRPDGGGLAFPALTSRAYIKGSLLPPDKTINSATELRNSFVFGERGTHRNRNSKTDRQTDK